MQENPQAHAANGCRNPASGRSHPAAILAGLLILLSLHRNVVAHADLALPQASVDIRTGLAPATFSLSTSAIPPGAAMEPAAVSATVAAPPGPIAVAKMRDTGPDRNRMVLVAMGDGYTEAELGGDVFPSQVNRFLHHFFSTSPWTAYSNLFNVYRIDVVSRESGADYEQASPAAGGALKDTFLDAHFWAGGLERSLALTGKGALRAFAVADAQIGARRWDEVLVFVNSTKYGGNGGAVTVSSIHPAADEIQVHELGHSLAGLADEYESGLSGTNCIANLLPNLDCGREFPGVKWQVWIEPNTPIPTPETPEYAGVIGAFKGGYYQTAGVYRPALDCKMRTLGVPFCVVCREALVLKLFQRVALVDAVSPPPGLIEVPARTPQTFVATPLSLPGMSFKWELAGVELTGQTNASLTLFPSDLPAPETTLSLVVTHSTPLVRIQPIQTRLDWRLKTAPNDGNGPLHPSAGERSPVVSLASLAGTVYCLGEPIGLTGYAGDVDGSVTNLVIFANGIPRFILGGPAFAVTWIDALPGTHQITAAATDDSGLTTTTAPILIQVLTAPVRYESLVARKSLWKYETTTNDLPAAWSAPSFDDANWSGPSNSVFSSGILPVGGPAETVLPATNPGERARAYYFRTHFELPNKPPAGLTLVASNLVLHGFVIHLNGVEAARLRMPEGGITRSTSAWPDAGTTHSDVLQLPGTHLRQGDNLLAVEVHTASDASPDITFGMSLAAVIRPPVSPTLSLQREPRHEHSYVVDFNGIPHSTYRIEYTENLATPLWLPLSSTKADPHGKLQHIDRPPAGTPQRYYRTVYP